MSSPRRHSLSRRTLLRIALAAGVGIIAATLATYRITYDAIEETRLELLSQYVIERARREEHRFLLAESNLKIMRDTFVEKLAHLDHYEDDGWFDRLIAKGEDGAHRTRRELVDPTRDPNTWIRAGVEVTPELKRLIRLSQDMCDQFFRVWRDQASSLYVTSPLQFNSGIAPILPEWVWDIAADFDQNEHEWMPLGTIEINPRRKPMWSGVIFDVSAPDSKRKDAFVTVVLPVDHEGRHLLNLNQDVYFQELLDSVLLPERPGVTHVLFRDDGRLIAHPVLWDELVASEGKYFLQDSQHAELRSMLATTAKLQEDKGAGYDPTSDLYFAACRLRGPDWWFVSLLPRAQVRMEASRQAQWVLWVGLITVGLVLAALAYILRSQIARPLGELLTATQTLAAGHPVRDLPAVDRSDELGELANAFNEMARKVTERDATLRAEKTSLEQRVSERTLELQQALEQARELARLKSNFISMVSHEYRNPLGVIVTSADILARYLDRLDPAERAEHVGAIQSAVKRMAGMMEDVLLLGQLESELRHCRPDDLHLAAFCRRLIEETRAVHGERCPLHFDAAPDLPLARADEMLLRHILGNLLSNAIKYSPDGAPVRLSLRRAGQDAVIEVSDSGIGIPEADLPHLFLTFHRGQNTSHLPGTGLGLVIVKRCVDLHGGRLVVTSREGAGTTFTLHLPVYPADTESTA